MNKKKTWADVTKGDVVELNGREWLVVKIKPKGKKAPVVVEYKGRRSESVVKLADKVKVITRREERDPLFDDQGRARRWATPREATVSDLVTLPTGDPDVVKPPEKAKHGDPWETPSGRIERKLDELLSARLVGVSKDESVGYYVPPVDVSSVAAHLALFHGGIPEACQDVEGAMILAHNAQHAAALKGEGVLAVNHWHTPTRPAK